MGPVLLRRAVGIVAAGLGRRRAAHGLEELAERFLDNRRLFALMPFYKAGQRGLKLQRLQILLDGLVIDVDEIESGIHLTLLHVGGESMWIVDAGVSHAMLPYGMYKLAGLGSHAYKVGVQLAVEVGFKDQI